MVILRIERNFQIITIINVLTNGTQHKKGGNHEVVNTERIAIRMSKSLLQQIKKQAKDNEMSVSAYVRMVLKKSQEGSGD